MEFVGKLSIVNMASPRWRQQLHQQTPSHRLPTFIIMFFLVVIIHTILTTRECGTSNTTDAAEKQDNCFYYDTPPSHSQRVQIGGSDDHRPPHNTYANTRTLCPIMTTIKPDVSGLRPQRLPASGAMPGQCGGQSGHRGHPAIATNFECRCVLTQEYPVVPTNNANKRNEKQPSPTISKYKNTLVYMSKWASINSTM